MQYVKRGALHACAVFVVFPKNISLAFILFIPQRTMHARTQRAILYSALHKMDT